ASLAFLNLAAVIDAFVWGALEILRNQLRTLPAPAAHIELTRWMTRALRLALCIFVASVSLLTWYHHARAPLSDAPDAAPVLEAYALFCALGLCIDSVARSYSSGIYAHQRVYRPVGVIMAIEPVGLVLVLALWRYWHEWSFPAAIGITTAVSRSLGI